MARIVTCWFTMRTSIKVNTVPSSCAGQHGVASDLQGALGETLDACLQPTRHTGMLARPSNDMQISCRPSSRRPHKLSFLLSHQELAALTEPRLVRPVGCICGLGGSPARTRTGCKAHSST